MASDEAKILLAKQAINEGQFNSKRAVAEIYRVNRETLRTRCLEVLLRRDCSTNSRIFSDLKEHVIVEYILDLDLRGFSPTVRYVKEITNVILVSRNAKLIGKNWLKRFVNR
jgi:hypothetical protein